jgi:DNA-binding transcriptional LysR family regulator
LELRHLRYFVAVAECQHFGQAAKMLHTAQPSLSYQIRQLEEDIGTPLFVRTTRKVRLTAAGETFLEEARQLLAQLERGLQHTRDVGAGMRGRLRLAYISGSMGSVLPLILRDFSGTYPDVAVELRSMWTDEQIEALREGKLDVGIFGNGLRPEGLTRTNGWGSQLMLAIPDGHELDVERPLVYADLEGQQLIVSRASGSRMSENILDVLRRHNVTASFAFQDAAQETIVGLVAARRGVALVPSSWSTMPHVGLRFRQIEPITYLPGLAFYWNTETADQTLRSFLESAAKSIANLAPEELTQSTIE